MFRPRMVWGGIERWRDPALSLLLAMLTRWNRFVMKRTTVPPLYEAGVRYIREDYESVHPEDWLDCLEVLSQGGGDCEDLACYRAAELQLRGERARAVWHRRSLGNGRTLLHIFVERGDGTLEDPSRLLGMET